MTDWCGCVSPAEEMKLCSRCTRRRFGLWIHRLLSFTLLMRLMQICLCRRGARDM